MADTPEGIIELTDIVEHGPGAKKSDSAEGGVDLSFERELEDLFADSSEDKPGAGEEGLPGLDGLELPDEDRKAEGDIDLDGLDALLADAGKAEEGGMDLPELTDDFFEQAKAQADSPGSADTLSFDAAMTGLAAGAAAATVAAVSPGDFSGRDASGSALEALTARLELLEEKLSGMGETLQASFRPMLNEALAVFRADMPAPAQDDITQVIEELRQSLEERIDSLKAGLPEPLDEDDLVSRVAERVLAAIPQPDAGDACLDADAVEGIVDARLEILKAGLPEPAEASPPDEQSIVASVTEQVLAAMPQPAASGLSGLASAEALDDLRRELLAEIQKTVPAVAARIIREEIQALVQDMD